MNVLPSQAEASLRAETNPHRHDPVPLCNYKRLTKTSSYMLDHTDCGRKMASLCFDEGPPTIRTTNPQTKRRSGKTRKLLGSCRAALKRLSFEQHIQIQETRVHMIREKRRTGPRTGKHWSLNKSRQPGQTPRPVHAGTTAKALKMTTTTPPAGLTKALKDTRSKAMHCRGPDSHVYGGASKSRTGRKGKYGRTEIRSLK